MVAVAAEMVTFVLTAVAAVLATAPPEAGPATAVRGKEAPNLC